MSKKSLKIVIDASVARASGTNDTVPSSTSSRQFLEEFRKTDNKILMTPEIFREWKKHRSKYAEMWRASMVASKKMEIISSVDENKEIRGAIESIHSPKIKREILKDVHLVEAAFIGDNYIVSNDNKVRGYLINLASNCSCIREITWMNPTNSNEEPIEWLKNGCKRDSFRKLGYSSEAEVASK